MAMAGAMALSGCGAAEEAEDDAAAGTTGDDTSSERHGITAADIQGAERVMGLAYTEAERQQLLTTIDDQIDAVVDARKLKITLSVSPALTFDPRLPGRDYGEQANIVASLFGPAPPQAWSPRA